jgi:hypothetical protein
MVGETNFIPITTAAAERMHNGTNAITLIALTERKRNTQVTPPTCAVGGTFLSSRRRRRTMMIDNLG